MVIGTDAWQTAPHHDADTSCHFVPVQRIRSRLHVVTSPSSPPVWFSEDHRLEASSQYLQQDGEHATGLRLPLALPTARREVLGELWSCGCGQRCLSQRDEAEQAAHFSMCGIHIVQSKKDRLLDQPIMAMAKCRCQTSSRQVSSGSCYISGK